MANQDDLLFVGTHGHVLAVDKATGRKRWETSLPKTGYEVVSIVAEDGQLFCASGGRVFALDGSTGKILWTNNLQGLGHGFVYLTTVEHSTAEGSTSVLRAAARTKAVAAGGGST